MENHFYTCFILILGVLFVDAISRDNLYPFGKDNNDNRMNLGDDISTDEIRLRLPILYYDDEHRSVFVNVNGHLSFETDIPTYRGDLILPLGYKLIVPFLSDVDTSLSGNVYYRESTDRELVQRAENEIHKYFEKYQSFRPRTLFIVTWENVGYYREKYDKLNTFQVVIASDGRSSFSMFLYPEDGLNWVRGDGKYAPTLIDAPGQAGFDAGDGARSKLLPNSGRQRVTDLSVLSNVNEPGVWLYKLGPTNGGNVEGPEVESTETEPTSCSDGGARVCSVNADCTDYDDGFCCTCKQGYFGNGKNCLKTGSDTRVNGKVTGTVNGKVLEPADLHAYVQSRGGRTYSAVSRVEASIGNSLVTLSSMAGVLGWVFAAPTVPKALNGYSVTGGDFNRTAKVTFLAGGEVITISQQVVGQDELGHMKINTKLNGTIPEFPANSRVRISDYKEEYQRVSSGLIKASSVRRLQVGTSVQNYRWEQTITYHECPGKTWDGPIAFRLKVSRNTVAYVAREETVRFTAANSITSIAGPQDPCKDAQCDPNAKCVAYGSEHRCECKEGYSGNGQQCADIDECRSSNDCDRNAECFNTDGSYQCRCRAGYRGDGKQCERDLSCADLTCDRNARCVYDSEIQRPKCECNTGFVGDGERCDPVEFNCNEVNNCHENAECVYDDETRRYKCECNDGFSGDGLTCEDTGEPDLNCRNCDTNNGECIYDTNRLVFHCQCKQGFTGDGTRCYPITAEDCDVADNCDVNADCLLNERTGRYECRCKYGFRGDGYSCEEEECNVVNNCADNAQCKFDSRTSRYACQCDEGYEGDGKTCRETVQPCNRLNNCHMNADCRQNPETRRYECLCRAGYEGDGYNCRLGVDCRRDPGLCDRNAICRQHGEEHVCVCDTGYRGDGRRCAPVGSTEQFLLFCQGRTIMQVPFEPSDDNKGKQILLIPGQTAIGIDSDCYTRYFYWTDVSRKVISKARLDGSDKEEIIHGLQSPEGVAVDWAAGNIYWADSGTDRIEVSRSDGTYRKTLFNTQLVNPRAIVVDPIRGVMFWTDWNREAPKIEMANMDGTDRRVLVNDDIRLPNGLAIVIEEQKLCWADAGTQHIECIGYDGHGRRIVYDLASYPFDVAFANDKFYWTDWHMRSLANIDNYSSEPNEPLELPPGGNGRLYGIAAVRSECPAGANACALNNGGCRYLCLPRPGGGRSCRCPDDVDEEECNEFNKVIKL